MNHKINFSLIINSYNRSLESLNTTIEQAVKSFPFEILVIDQNEKALGLKYSNVSVFHFPHKAISKARNFAAAEAKGNWLVFLDDDALINESSLKNLEQFLINESTQIVGGKIMVQDNPSEYYSKRQKLQSGQLSFLQLKAVMGGLFAIEKKKFIILQGFDEHFGIGALYPSSEDTDLIWKAYFQKNQISFCSDFIALHPRSSHISSEKAFLYGIGKGAMVAKWFKSKGKMLVLIEAFEMIIVPLLKSNYASLKGRIKGWRSYRS
ncbi:MAG: glycosyltransferase family 2 protein [Bacteriovoracaceae bacterium]